MSTYIRPPQNLLSLLLSYFVAELQVFRVDHILSRANIFETTKDIDDFTICPTHRSNLGVGWRRGSNSRCRVPKEVSSHGKDMVKSIPEVNRGIGNRVPQIVFKISGKFNLAPVHRLLTTVCKITRFYALKMGWKLGYLKFHLKRILTRRGNYGTTLSWLPLTPLFQKWFSYTTVVRDMGSALHTENLLM